MKVGNLVNHDPAGSPIEIILRKLSPDELHPDFSLGLIIDVEGKRSRVYAATLRGLFWYDNSELLIVN
jgi:hypothetical protein